MVAEELGRWRDEWQARGEMAFPGIGRRGVPAGLSESQRIGELERKIGQLTMENDFLKKTWEHLRDHHPPAVVSGEVACLRKSVQPRKAASKPTQPMMGRPGKQVKRRRGGKR
jgi:hypothetical protein